MPIILYRTNLLHNKWKFTNAFAFFAEHIELSCRWRWRSKSRCRCRWGWSVSGLNLMKLVPEVNIRNLSNWEMEKKREILQNVGKKLWNVSGSDVFVLPPVSLIFFIFFACGESGCLIETVSKEWQRGGEAGHPANKKHIGLVTQRGGSHSSGKTEIITVDIQHFFRFVFCDILFLLIFHKLCLEALFFHCCHHFLLLLSCTAMS